MLVTMLMLIFYKPIKNCFFFKLVITVTSRLFTHIVSTEKNMRDCKDMRDTNYTYCIGCFSILLLIKSRLGTFPL